MRGCHHVAHKAHSAPYGRGRVDVWLSLLHVQVRSKRPSNEQRATILLTVSAAVKVHHLNHPRDLNFGDVVHAQQDIESAAARAGLFPNEAGQAKRMHAILCGCSASAVRPSTDAQLAAQCTW